MKSFNYFSFLIFFLGIAFTANANDFETTPGRAYDIDIDQKDGLPVVVGQKSGHIFKWNTSRKNWDKIAAAPVKARKISCKSAARHKMTLYIIGENNYVYGIENSKKWKKYQLQAIDVSVGKDGAVYAIGKDGRLYGMDTFTSRDSKGKKTHIKSFSGRNYMPNNVRLTRVATYDNNRLTVIQNGGTVYEITNQKARKRPGTSRNVAYNHQGKLFVAGKGSGKVWYWGNNKWKNVSARYTPFFVASGKQGTWFVRKNGTIYKPAAPKKKTNYKPKNKRNKEGTYEVTITKIRKKYGSDSSLAVDALSLDGFKAQFYGVMGIRAYVLHNTGKQEIKAFGGANPRVWDISKRSPLRASKEGNLSINKKRKFVIQKHHFKQAGAQIVFNVQANLGEKDVVFSDDYRWGQISIPLEELDFSYSGSRYKDLIVVEKGREKRHKIAVTITIKKIN